MDKKKDLLLIFTRNPELGKCKTRLASTIGDKGALDIYRFLLGHTARITKNLNVEKWVYYSESIWENDAWNNNIYQKKLQEGTDLGTRMYNAFMAGFGAGFKKIIIIGSDMYDLGQIDIEKAFSKLDSHNFVVGPAEDGGYYLLGMTILKAALFQHKMWGTETVLEDTLHDLKSEHLYLLPQKNDVDRYEDIKDVPAFQPYLKHIKK